MKLCSGRRKFSEFQVDVLDAHNEFRSRHGVQPLILNDKLCKYSEDHAKFISQCDSSKLSKGPYGENIIKSSLRKIYPDAFEPINKWYSEIKNYNENVTSPSKDIKHFAQIVWKETRTMGVGYAVNEDKTKLYVVANYYPAGNDYQAFSSNVNPPKKNLRTILKQRSRSFEIEILCEKYKF